MELNITTRLTATQAVLMLIVVASAGVAVHVFTEESLVGESLQAAESEAYRVSQQLSGQLDVDVLVGFSTDPLPFRDAQVSMAHWAVVRGGREFLLGGGSFVDGGERFQKDALASDLVDRPGGSRFRIVSLPFPKFRSESFIELPEAVRATLQREVPGGLFLRAKRESAGGKDVREIELVKGHKFREIKITADGDVVDDESVRLPESLPRRVAESFFGVEISDEEVPVSWSTHDSQLLMCITLPGLGPIVVNRYLERFRIAEGGDISGPTETSSLRLLVATDVTHVERAMDRLLGVLLAGGAVVWLVTVAIGWFVMRRAFFPVRKILDAASRIEPTHLDARLPAGKVRDELYSIAETINRMLDRLEKGFRRERRFTGDASHELRGPLAKITAEIDVALSRDRSSEAYRDALERCRLYASGLQRIVESLLMLTRLDQPGVSVGDVAVDIQNVLVDCVRALPEGEGRRVRLDLWKGKAPLLVRGRAELLGVLIRNLLENALGYSSPEEPVVARILSDAISVLLEVEDRGPGIPEGTRERVFDRFYRLDASRSRGTGGVGLGLAIVRSIARAHGGDVILSRSPTGGTVATVRLPAIASAGVSAAIM